MSNTLWTVPYQATGQIIRAAAAWGGVPVELPGQYTHMEDNKKPEFLSKFPHGKIPAWEGADGFKLFEGIAIARYVANLAPNSGLIPSDPKEAALVDQWVHLAENEVDIHTSICYALVHGHFPYNKAIHHGLMERQVRTLKTLNAHLASRTFFVGERITLADIVVAVFVQRAATVTFDAPLRAELFHLVRHYDTIINQPKFQGILERQEVIEKALQYVPPPKEKKEKESKPAAEPKAEKKPKVKPGHDEDEDDDIPQEPKAKNPLDDLPKSTLNLEDWKRDYSNKDTRVEDWKRDYSNKDTRGPGGALEWFYQNFDKEGFSLWRFDFKYNNELTKTFMSGNQITGFYNRLEASRKYLFASAGVLGEENNSVIAGAMILRGKDYKPVVEVAPDWESYDYKALDLDNAEDKTFFEAALAWDLEIDGKKWAVGKNFK